MDDSPGGLALLLKKGSGGPSPMDMPRPSDKLPSGLEDAAQDILDAIKTDDRTHLANALYDAWSLCGGEGDDADEAPSDQG